MPHRRGWADNWYRVVHQPPTQAYHATATVLLVYNQNQDPYVEVQTEASLAQSKAVAERVVQQLKLPQSVASLQAAYTVTVVTENVLTFNIGAPFERRSGTAGIGSRYNLSPVPCPVRAGPGWSNCCRPARSAVQRGSSNALMRLKRSSARFPAQTTPAQKDQEYNNLQTQIGQQRQVIQYVTNTKSTAKTSTNGVVTGGCMLNTATVLPHSHIKGPALYFRSGGLFGGIVIGMGGVIITALLSRRLRFSGRCRACAGRARKAQRR